MRSMIFIGYDRREHDAFAVAVHSIKRHLQAPVPIRGLMLSEMQKAGLYRRPTKRDGGALIDLLSVTDGYKATMSTEHANARFLVPHLTELRSDNVWSLFMDCDMLARCDLSTVFDGLDESKALYCVQHDFAPTETVKMDGQVQSRYARKLWSSFMIFNCGHPANARLTLQLINTAPGRDLHRLCWLDDDEIGALDPSWNWVHGHSDPAIEPRMVHFTAGLPDMDGYHDVPFADAWRAELVQAITRP